jgi:TldD protein
MKDLTQRALDTATAKGASYADIRLVRRNVQSIMVKNGRVEALTSSESYGFGVRVVADGAWGFAGSSEVTADEVDRVAAQAVAIARASAIVRGQRAVLGEPMRHEATYRTPVTRDPFAVSLDDKIALLLRASEEMERVQGIAVAEGSVEIWREEKVFANTEGSYIEQDLVETGCGLEAMAVGPIVWGVTKAPRAGSLSRAGTCPATRGVLPRRRWRF